MNRFQSGIKGALALFISGAVTIMITLDGCKRQKGDHQKFVFDLAVTSLTNMADKNMAPDLGKRAKAALSKLKNGVLDTEPNLILAIIGFPKPSEPALNIIYFDEDRDIRGLRVKEQYIDPNGMTTTIEEDYPLFVNALDTLISEHTMFPIRIRDKNQRKDRCLWLEYANLNLDELIRKYLDKKQHVGDDTFTRGVLWKEKEMPPVYISVPDPNKVQVFISIYDRAGNESESIKLLATPSIKSEYLPQHNIEDR